jgi:ribonuclease Z
MTTAVTLTGTGTPLEEPGQAGASVLVRAEDLALQFDAGRAITLRWADAGLDCHDLTAVFLTHHHSDHLTGLADLVLTSWEKEAVNPLPIIAPLGPTADFAERVLEPWRADLAVRMVHVEAAHISELPAVDVRAFGVRRRPVRVWECGNVAVDAIEVHHEPVVPAVGYRVTTPAGTVAISGDTVVCEEVEELAHGCDVLVHEAGRNAVLRQVDEAARRVAEYHADTVEIGALAARAGVRVLMLTHLMPAPRSDEEERAFLDDVRRGGFQGEVVVGRDLSTVWLSGPDAEPEIAPGIPPGVAVDVRRRPTAAGSSR